MLTKPPPLAAALHLSLALDALQMADEALGEMFAALGEVELEDQGPIDSYDVVGFRATCKLFLELFAPAKEALGIRAAPCPPLAEKIREHIQAQADSPGNPPGLERAGLALEFAVGAIGDAVDVLDSAIPLKGPSGDEWYSPCIAAHDVLSMIQGAIKCGTVRGRGPGAFDQGFFGRN
jgi:hypothetical protein